MANAVLMSAERFFRHLPFRFCTSGKNLNWCRLVYTAQWRLARPLLEGLAKGQQTNGQDL